MYLKKISIEGFKSFGNPVTFSFPSRITGIVGPNGSGKSNVTEAFRFVLGEQSIKSMRGRKGEDLIFNGGTGAARAQRAAVSIMFDNTDRLLDNAFDEVTVSRTVYRDGSNEYRINDTQVRHRDIAELFARTHVGITGHHIISQGEADRILCCSPEERKDILENGLGLKALQYRRIDAERKLARARRNIAEADISLREITPHMRHLKRQVDRYEEARTVRAELETMYADYLSREAHYLTATRKELDGREREYAEKMRAAVKKIDEKKKRDAVPETDDTEMRDLEETARNIRTEKDSVVRKLGGIEGEKKALADMHTGGGGDIPRGEIAALHADIQKRLDGGEEAATVLTRIMDTIRELLHMRGEEKPGGTRRQDVLLREEKAAQETLKTLEERERKCAERQEEIRREQETKIRRMRDSEESLIALITEKNDIERELNDIRHAAETLRGDEERMEREIQEGDALIGPAINRYKKHPLTAEEKTEEREKQKERGRLLERKKITLETVGTDSGEAVYREYEEVSGRVEFLNGEKDDLLSSIRQCEECIQEIRKEIDTRFRDGIKKINAEFEKFFKTLFGGGTASIGIEKKTVQKEDEEPEERIGVIINVSLPRKKIRSLEQLSGGERALVSIALLFAISQVTPPPFLILDETDAALDEENSRRYTGIIQALAKHSQLILVTHNRGTMHCAETLYGVTMNATGISTVLSVQFEDAVRVAK